MVVIFIYHPYSTEAAYSLHVKADKHDQFIKAATHVSDIVAGLPRQPTVSAAKMKIDIVRRPSTTSERETDTFMRVLHQ